MSSLLKDGTRPRLPGDVARELGIGVQTLHYYEREGLIPPPDRTEAGYRLYTPAVVERVRFIRKAQALGLPLAEIREVVSLAERGSSPCGRVQAALAKKLREADARLRELRSFRDDLARLVEEAPALEKEAGSGVCAIVEEGASRRGAPPAALPLGGRRGAHSS